MRIPKRRTVILFLVGVLIALPLAGCLYESAASARDARRFPPPGTLVEVGGRRLHLGCIGRGEPTDIFEASGFSNSAGFEAARSEVAGHTRVCSYDRMGAGWSDRGPTDVSAGMLADDLRRLQDNAALVPPFIIVPASIGGLTTELFARRYPDRVAGLIFTDAVNSEMIPIANATFDRWQAVAACAAIAGAARVGLVRLLDPFALRASSSDAAARSAALMYGAKPWITLCSEVSNMRTSEQEFARAPALRADVPLIVLTAETTAGVIPSRLDVEPIAALSRLRKLLPLLRETHQHLAQRSTRGSWRMVPGSDHLIATSRPQAVVDAVLELLTQIRRAAQSRRLGGPWEYATN